MTMRGPGRPRPPGMYMDHGMSGRPEMQQRLVMTPRVREAVDERSMRARALLPKRRVASSPEVTDNNGD